jgi:uncharacterized membrane protein YraQ (UPF0718 family)
VVARFAASFLTAVGVGLVWSRVGTTAPRPARQVALGGGQWGVFSRTFVQEFAQAGAFLVLGAAATATLQVTASATLVASLGSSGFLGVPILGLLAVVLCVCSEADAFVAATLSQSSPTARLAFMVVGPVVDLKLIALQSGTFGSSFVRRLAPITFAIAILASIAVGAVLL